MTESFDILRYPHITEKAALQKEQSEGRVVVFKVDRSVSKHQVKEAVKKVFSVEVEQVRTANFEGKVKRQGRHSGRRSRWKKAIVTLKPDQKMPEFFETA